MPERPTLEEVYRAQFRFVWRALRRLGVREGDAEDAAQEVFLVVTRKLAEFEGRSSVTTWLYGICFRVARDRARAARARREVPDGDLLLDVPDAAADPASEVSRAQARALLEEVLDTMPIEQRAVFAFFELGGMTGEEIAAMLDVPVDTVYSRLRLARAVFRAGLSRVEARVRFLEASAGGRS